MERFERLINLLGENSFKLLQQSHIAIFGIGGVGGYALESLVRCGIEHIDIIDNDIISISNINRQIIALDSTLGKFKTEVAKARALDINPKAKVKEYRLFFNKDTYYNFNFKKYDYIIDAIDSVPSKIFLIEKAIENNIQIISSMGMGNKINPTMIEVADIYKTSVCPLARKIRGELKKRGIKKLKTVYSKESPTKNSFSIPSSCSFVPSVAGLIMASEVVKNLTNQQEN